MKRNILVYGFISGLTVSVITATTLRITTNSGDFDGGIWLGYASMLIAFSMIFVAIKNYRDKSNGSLISFGKASGSDFL